MIFACLRMLFRRPAAIRTSHVPRVLHVLASFRRQCIELARGQCRFSFRRAHTTILCYLLAGVLLARRLDGTLPCFRSAACRQLINHQQSPTPGRRTPGPCGRRGVGDALLDLVARRMSLPLGLSWLSEVSHFFPLFSSLLALQLVSCATQPPLHRQLPVQPGRCAS